MIKLGISFNLTVKESFALKIMIIVVVVLIKIIIVEAKKKFRDHIIYN